MYPPSMAGPAPSRNDTVNPERRFSEIYFGYASNLSPLAMKGRCPDSLFAGLAKLSGWKFQINSTGYGNIIPSDDPEDHVIGALFFLSPRDEAGLDESEGVPWLYEKKWVRVQRVGRDGSVASNAGDAEVMTYVDVQRTDEGPIMPDYCVWIYKAIRDSKQYGLGEAYVEKFLRPWLPKDSDGDEARDLEAVRVMSSRPNVLTT